MEFCIYQNVPCLTLLILVTGYLYVQAGFSVNTGIGRYLQLVCGRRFAR